MDAFFVEHLHNCRDAHDGKVSVKDQLNGLCLLRYDDVFAVLIAVTQQSAISRHAVLKVPLDAPFLILACGQTLLLSIGCQDRKHPFTVCTDGVDVLLLKIYVHSYKLGKYSHSASSRIWFCADSIFVDQGAIRFV